MPAVFADVAFIYSTDIEYVGALVVGDNLVSFTVNQSHV